MVEARFCGLGEKLDNIEERLIDSEKREAEQHPN